MSPVLLQMQIPLKVMASASAGSVAVSALNNYGNDPALNSLASAAGSFATVASNATVPAA